MMDISTQKKITIYLSLMLILLIFFPCTIDAKPHCSLSREISSIDDDMIYVDDDNVDGPWYGTLQYPFRYIHQGVGYAFNGDTVFVFNGTYTESSIEIYNSINLIGENRNKTIIDGFGVSTIYLYYDNITVSGFKIKKASASAIYIVSNKNTVKDCVLTDCDHGIGFGGVSNNTISGNLIENCAIGLRAGESNNYNTFSDNIIKYNAEGIRLSGSQHNSMISNNYFYDNSVGVSFWDDVVSSTISNNIFVYNRCAISLGSSSSNNVLENYFQLNDVGIDSRGSGNIFVGNTIVDNKQGINLMNSGNKINNNNFYKNFDDIDFTYYSFFEKNNWNHNYWNESRFWPKPIWGVVIIYSWYEEIEYKRINFDWFPRSKPYDAGEQ